MNRAAVVRDALLDIGLKVEDLTLNHSRLLREAAKLDSVEERLRSLLKDAAEQALRAEESLDLRATGTHRHTGGRLVSVCHELPGVIAEFDALRAGFATLFEVVLGRPVPS